MITRAPSLERRALSGSVANLASIVAILVQNLALVPVLLHRWPADTYGIWITLLAVQSLIFTVNYGQEAYVGYEAARLLHEDRPALPGLIGAGLFVGVVLGLLEVLLILGLGLSHLTSLFGAGPATAEGWKPLIIIVGAWVGFGSSANILIRVAYALGFYSRFTLYSVLFRLTVAAAIGVSATLGAGLWGAAIAYGLTTLLTQACLAAMALRVLREYRIEISRPRMAFISSILTRSVVVSGTSLLDAFSDNGLLTIISSVLSARLVPSFSTLRTITNTAKQGVGVIMHPLDPDMIRYHASKEFSKLYEVFSVCWMVAGSAVNFGLCVAPLFIEPLYHVWTRGKLSFDFPLFFLLALSVAFRTLGHPALAFLQAKNAIDAQAKISVVRAVLVITLSLVLIHPFGLVGVGAALAISELIGAAVLPAWYALREFSASRVPFPLPRMITAVGSVIVVGIAFGGYHSFPSLKGVVCCASAAIVAVLAYAQWTMLRHETRCRMLSVLRVPRRPGESNPTLAEPVKAERPGR